MAEVHYSIPEPKMLAMQSEVEAALNGLVPYSADPLAMANAVIAAKDEHMRNVLELLRDYNGRLPSENRVTTEAAQ